jgi:holo-ACP synthase CitX
MSEYAPQRLAAPDAELGAALAERERRAAESTALLNAGAVAVVRLSARMPSSLRRRGLAAGPIARGAALFESECRRRYLPLKLEGGGDGALGPWLLWTSSAAPPALKAAALFVEEASWLGLLLDLDVQGSHGVLSRAGLCLPPRACVLCGAPAMVCSGRRAHAAPSLENAFTYILRRSGATELGSQDGNAVGASTPLTIREIA